MLRNALGSMVVLALLFAAGCATGESFVDRSYDFSQVEKVAIVEVAGAVGGEVAKNAVADFFVIELLKKGYAPVERKQVHDVLKEQEFQASDLTTAEGAARAGRILNVSAVLVANIPEYGQKINMTAKLIDVETARIIWAGSGSGSTGRMLATLGGGLLGAAGGSALGGGRSGKIVGGIAGGAVGGAAGYALTPQERNVLKKVIRKTCRDLPSASRAPASHSVR